MPVSHLQDNERGNIRSQKPTLAAKAAAAVLGHFFLDYHLLTEEHLVKTIAVDIFISFSLQGHSMVKRMCLSSVQFNISYQRIQGSHYYPAHPWQNTPVIVTDNKTKKKRETLTDMQIQTPSPSYVLSLPLILPIITLTPFCHFSFTYSFFLTNALSLCLSFIPFYLSCLFSLAAPFCLSLCFQLYFTSLCLAALFHHALGFRIHATFYFIYNDSLCLIKEDSSSDKPALVPQGISLLCSVWGQLLTLTTV